MYKNRVLQQKCINNLDETKESLSFNKTIDSVINLSNNLEKGERIIIEQRGIGYSAKVIKLREGYQNDYPYDASEWEVKSEYQF